MWHFSTLYFVIGCVLGKHLMLNRLQHGAKEIMNILGIAIKYGVTPVFFILAYVNFMAERKGSGGHAMHSDMGHAMEMAAIQPSLLTSMWLMYLLMGVAHILPYIPGQSSKN